MANGSWRFNKDWCYFKLSVEDTRELQSDQSDKYIVGTRPEYSMRSVKAAKDGIELTLAKRFNREDARWQNRGSAPSRDANDFYHGRSKDLLVSG